MTRKIHYDRGKVKLYIKPKTACGRISAKVMTTRDKRSVTCTRCNERYLG